MIYGTQNSPVLITATLLEGDTNLYPRVKVFSTTGAVVATVDLTYVADGNYASNTWSPSSIGYYHANCIIYTNSSRTAESDLYGRSGALVRIDDAYTLLNNIPTAVNTLLSTSHGAGSWEGGGGGTSSGDWTSGEKEQIRWVLGVDGTKTLATGGQLQGINTTVIASYTSINALRVVDNAIASTVNAIKPKTDTILWTDVTAIKTKTDQLLFNSGFIESIVYSWAPGALTILADYVWDETAADHVTAGTFGRYLDTTISAIKTKTDTIIWGDVTTIKAQTDKMTFTGSDIKATLDSETVAITPSDKSLMADVVWDEVQSGHTTAGTFGKMVDTTISAIKTQTDTINWPTVTSIYADTNELQTDWVNGGRLDTTLDAIKAKTDTIVWVDVTSIRAQTDKIVFTGSDIKATLDGEEVVVATNNDKTGYTLTAADKSLTADVVWDELHSGHTIAGTFGQYLDTSISGSSAGVTPAIIADAVWDEAHTDHIISGTFGQYLDSSISGSGGGASVAAIADAVWDETQSGHTAASTFGKYLDYQLSLTNSNVTTVGTTVNAIKTKTDTILWTDITAIASTVNAIKSKTDPINWGDVTAIKTQTDKLVFTGSYVWTTLSAAVLGAMADQVWDEAQSGHVAAGTFGKYVDYQLSTLNANVVAVNTSVSAVAGNVIAIKAKTDTINWPDITAIASTVNAIKVKTDTINWPAISTISAATDGITTIDGVVDAIKLKTDTINWPTVTSIYADWTDSGRLDLLLDAVKAKTDTILWTDVTAIASTVNAIKTKTDTILWTDVTSIKAQTDKLTFTGSYVWSTVSGALLSGIADTVWDEPSAGHTTDNTFGKYLDSTISAIKTKTDTIVWSDITAIGANLLLMNTTVGAIRIKTDTINWPAVTSILADTDTINWTNVTDIKIKTDTINWPAITSIKASTDTIAWTDITFLKDVEGGRWIRDGTQMRFYKADNASIIATFELKDSNGNPAGETTDVFERVRA
jgi:hypothetical protein